MAYLSKYLCSKLQEHYTISTAALRGLQHLLVKHMGRVVERAARDMDAVASQQSSSSAIMLKEAAFEIVKSMLNEVHVQSMIQSDRFRVFSMCNFVLKSNELARTLIVDEKYESDFVYGFIQAMDGEKDPRNLLICFETIHLICTRLKLGPFVEETFEIFSCYFPIDFTPVNSI